MGGEGWRKVAAGRGLPRSGVWAGGAIVPWRRERDPKVGRAHWNRCPPPTCSRTLSRSGESTGVVHAPSCSSHALQNSAGQLAHPALRTPDPRLRNTTERTAREVYWSGQRRTSLRDVRTYSVTFRCAPRVDPDLSGLQRTRSVALKWHLTRGRRSAEFRTDRRSSSSSSPYSVGTLSRVRRT